MLGNVKTIAFNGFSAILVNVQAHIGTGLPAFNIVGLADKSVAESKERVRAALSSMGLGFPAGRITVNLSPADLPKEGTHFDLPIALSLLVAMGIIKDESIKKYIALGELSLDGSLVSIGGVLVAASYAINNDFGIICPEEQGGEASWIDNLSVLSPSSLLHLKQYFDGNSQINKPEPYLPESIAPFKYYDLSEIKGQERAKRALEIAACGGHNMLMVGPPGTGKSMLASAIIGILPNMYLEESLEVSKIYSLAGRLDGRSLIRYRPYRAPHHSASMVALVGGGKRAKPGEITLANNGVLFLDELPEFQPQVLDSLRQPLESGMISIARANSHVDYPAKIQLIAAMNPCKCGNIANANLACNKAPECAMQYQNKISGPMYDRFDLSVNVPAVLPHILAGSKESEKSEVVKKRVINVRELQRERYKDYGVLTNSQANGAVLEKFLEITDSAKKLLENAAEKFSLSARGYHRAIKVAKTISDMEFANRIEEVHMAEALSYRHSQYQKLKK